MSHPMTKIFPEIDTILHFQTPWMDKHMVLIFLILYAPVPISIGVPDTGPGTSSCMLPSLEYFLEQVSQAQEQSWPP